LHSFFFGGGLLNSFRLFISVRIFHSPNRACML
jgi:hypothetical protein